LGIFHHSPPQSYCKESKIRGQINYFLENIFFGFKAEARFKLGMKNPQPRMQAMKQIRKYLNF